MFQSMFPSEISAELQRLQHTMALHCMCKPVAALTISTGGEYALNLSWVDLLTGAKKKQKFTGDNLFARATDMAKMRPTSASAEAQKKVAALQAVLDLKLWGGDDMVKDAIQKAADKLRATF